LLKGGLTNQKKYLEHDMPVPKRKRSRARRDKRFANKGIKVKIFTECKNCKEPMMPHQVCKSCGFYKGIKVMNTKIDRAIKRGKTRQDQMVKKQQREGEVAEQKKEEPSKE